MQKPQYHFFLCNSFRANGEPQGVCNKKGAVICCNICKAKSPTAASTPSSPPPVA